MKKILVIGVFLLLSFCILPVYAQTTEVTLGYKQAQFQWRGSAPFGAWSSIYQNDNTESDYVLTGKALHTAWSYSPLVENLTGQSTVYKYDKKSELWIEKEGQVHYEYPPGYGDYIVANYFRGYLDFGGDPPSNASFEHGVAYQWVYLLAPEDAVLSGSSTQYARWDDKVGAWLVGFSIYLWDSGTQAYAIPFPDPFIGPIPAKDYNPFAW
jgi:hypothetical protein